MTATFFTILPWIALGVAWAVPAGDLPPEGADSGVPSYVCQRIKHDLVISGKVDDPLWQQAHAVHLMAATNGLPGRYRTAEKMLYNSRFLCLAFECQDDFVWGTLTNRDADLFSEECVEAFTCPSGKVRQYYEINVGPLCMVTKMKYRDGNHVPFHSHPNEQAAFVLSGRIRVRTRKQEVVLEPGDRYVIPGNEEHAIDIIEPAEEVQVFTPPRADYL